MAWVQIKPFSLSKMGKKKNFCLNNVRTAFGVAPKYATAKLAMNENKSKGTLHAINTLPKNVAVPLYTDKGVWGHIIVSDHGTIYSDGVKVNWSLNNYKWGEYINGVQIVRWQPSTKTILQLADEVLQGLWGNGKDRKTRLEKAGYDYNAVQTEVNNKLNKNVAKVATSNTIKVGDSVYVYGKGSASSLGAAPFTAKYNGRRMRVISIANGRYGLNRYDRNGGITGWWLGTQIKKA